MELLDPFLLDVPLRILAETAVRAQEHLARLLIALELPLEQRNRDLAESLEQQTATSVILRAISTSPTEPGQALALIAESASRFTHVGNILIWQVVDEGLVGVD